MRELSFLFFSLIHSLVVCALVFLHFLLLLLLLPVKVFPSRWFKFKDVMPLSLSLSHNLIIHLGVEWGTACTSISTIAHNGTPHTVSSPFYAAYLFIVSRHVFIVFIVFIRYIVPFFGLLFESKVYSWVHSKQRHFNRLTVRSKKPVGCQFGIL